MLLSKPLASPVLCETASVSCLVVSTAARLTVALRQSGFLVDFSVFKRRDNWFLNNKVLF